MVKNRVIVAVLMAAVVGAALGVWLSNTASRAQAAAAGNREKWEYLTITSVGNHLSFEAPDNVGDAASEKSLADQLGVKVLRTRGDKDVYVTDILNALGADGWELAVYSQAANSNRDTRYHSWLLKRHP